MALLAVAALLACATAPAQAATGGAGTTASSGAQLGSGLAFTPLRWAGATWYGPGLYGRSTACGQKLRPGLLGVAHRNLPCGTPVKFVYRGRQVVTRVIDRGPYSHGNDWDLTLAAARILRFERVGRDHVGFALSRKFARKLRAKRRSSR
ncbi:MAG TPA: septal ring lytic transglycosylase RlpA family protein [Solirubrobacterales bacterium]|nr:septal ring lytic transglycosylase RlpA family protein [Solirubrobacterales bacterium]